MLHLPCAAGLVSNASSRTVSQRSAAVVSGVRSVPRSVQSATWSSVQPELVQGVVTARHAPLTVCRAATESAPASSSGKADLAGVPDTSKDCKLISKTEVAAFIMRDDMMDQMLRWAVIEAGEGGVRNFGLPMTVDPFYLDTPEGACLWGFRVGIFKEGERLCDLGIMFDQENVNKHEWVGRGDDGFPVLEGKIDAVLGKHLEIWKLDAKPVDENLRSAIRAFCTGLVTALNRYYAFGSVFVDDGR